MIAQLERCAKGQGGRDGRTTSDVLNGLIARRVLGLRADEPIVTLSGGADADRPAPWDGLRDSERGARPPLVPPRPASRTLVDPDDGCDLLGTLTGGLVILVIILGLAFGFGGCGANGGPVGSSSLTCTDYPKGAPVGGCE